MSNSCARPQDGLSVVEMTLAPQPRREIEKLRHNAEAQCSCNLRTETLRDPSSKVDSDWANAHYMEHHPQRRSPAAHLSQSTAEQMNSLTHQIWTTTAGGVEIAAPMYPLFETKMLVVSVADR